MRAKWFLRLRQIHTYLSVFFSPLLLLFIFTGGWQTFTPDDSRDKGAFNTLMLKFSSIHTDNYFPRNGAEHHASATFKYFVAAMVASLMTSILIGLILACQNRRNIPWVVAAFLLGIVLPALALFLA